VDRLAIVDHFIFGSSRRRYLRLAMSKACVLLIACLLMSAGMVLSERAGTMAQSDLPLPAQSQIARNIVGNTGMEEILGKFNELYTRTHPGFQLAMLLKGSHTSLSGLTAGVSAFAPMDREATPLELRPFRQMNGYEPLDIHIGRHGYAGPGRFLPPAVYVNSRNPIAGMTADQVARIFTTGGGNGDYTHWGQVGLHDNWVDRVIHVYGLRDDGDFATSLRHSQMGGFPFTRRYEPMSSDADVLRAVAEDPYGVGLIGFFDSRIMPENVRMVPLAAKEGEAYSTATFEEVQDGKYPYAPYLRFYVNRAPGEPLDSFVKEYTRLVLSQDGQAIVEAARNSREGCVPLTASEITRELAKLE
jgi:phosphate transport system substrate-binding protein